MTDYFLASLEMQQVIFRETVEIADCPLSQLNKQNAFYFSLYAYVFFDWVNIPELSSRELGIDREYWHECLTKDDSSHSSLKFYENHETL